MNLELLLTLIGALLSILLGIIAWIGNGMVSKLETISQSLQKIEKDFGVLNNDHTNFKEKVKEDLTDVKHRLTDLESAR